MTLIFKRTRLFLIIVSFLLSFSSLVHADILDHWQWRNPLPQGNTLYNVTYGENTFVAVGWKGIIVTSANGYNWKLRPSTTTNSLYAVTYANHMFVAVGQAGSILTSVDGLNWIKRTSGTVNDLNGITYGNDIFVAVGSGGTILTSSNGQNWTARTSGTTANLSCLAYGNGIFVVGGERTLTSPDGVTWAIETIIPNMGYHTIAAIAYHNNVFIADRDYHCGAGYCFYNPGASIQTSSDGKTWTEKAFFFGSSINALIYGGDKFVGVGTLSGAASFTSSDGNTWVEHSCCPEYCIGRFPLNSIAYGNSTYVAVGVQGYISVSTNGITWSDGDSRLIYREGRLNDIVYGNAGFVAVGGARQDITYENSDPLDEGYMPILTSPDGLVWTARNSGISKATLYAVAYGNNTYVATGGHGIILTSSNGVDWTQRTSGTDYEIYTVTYGNGTFAAISNGSYVLTSPDGINWTKRKPENVIIPNDMTYGGGLFIAVGYDGNISTSPDGITWTKRNSGTTNYLYGIAYSNNIFIAVGDKGTILTSPDGIAWTARAAGIENRLNGVYFGNNIFIVYGDGDYLNSGSFVRASVFLTSTDGITWTPRTSGALFPSLSGIAYGNNTFVAIGKQGTILQTTASSARSNNATISGYTETNTISGAPSYFTVSKVVSFTATNVSGSADFSVTFASLPANPVFFKVVGNTWKQLYPANECSGISNISLTGTTLNDTMAASSDCNGTTSPHTIVDPLVAGSMPASSGGGRGGCFIATAAYNSNFHPFVAILKSFRDKFLLMHVPGQAFVAWYYRISPPIADVIRTSALMKQSVRILLLPLVGFSYLCLTLGVIPASLIFLLSFGMIGIGIRKLYFRHKRDTDTSMNPTTQPTN